MGHGDGQNLLWTQQVAVNRAVINQDYTLASAVFQAMWGHVAIVPQAGEGVQRDASFHFHGTILYSGGYGGDYAVNIASYANITQGTPFQVSGAPLRIMSHYLLDGQRWMTQTGFGSSNVTRYDVSVKGREISALGAASEAAATATCHTPPVQRALSTD